MRVSRSKWGSKYSSGVMAVGLVGLAACRTGACGDTGTAQPPLETPSSLRDLLGWPLTPLWVPCCCAMPRKEWKGVLEPAGEREVQG